MRTFSIEKTADSPAIFIDESTNLIEITGNSTLNETGWFYGNLSRWIKALHNFSIEKKTINIKLGKVNNSSMKRFLDLFQLLYQRLPSTIIEINWYTEGNSSNARILFEKMLNKPGMIVKVF